MNKKLVIQLAVIIIAFGAAGIILYNGFFGGSLPSPVSPTGTPASAPTPQQILPYGSASFDFTPLTSRPFIFNQIQYPTINPTTDVGIPESNLISSNQAGSGH